MLYLKNYDDYINDKDLQKLAKKITLEIDKIQKNTHNLYQLLIVTPTYTREEIQQQRDREKNQEKDYDSKITAYRISKGLHPKPHPFIS